MSIRALAIETSSRIGSVALAEDGKTLAADSFPHGLQHAARIIPVIDDLCRRLRWTSSDFREIYVSAGPGSFTGLRIGITMAKTLAFATNAKLVAVPSVRVLVENAPADAKNVIIVLDAKRDQIFTASFERQANGWSEVQPAHLGTLADMLAKFPRPVHLIGEGIPYHRKFIPENEPGIFITDESSWRPDARIVATLGWQLARAGKFTDAMSLRPIYIRKPEAEEKLDGP
jgi:tRNA threonylcarbamoyladenosine biosynthesis protein TsaB